MSDEKLFNEHIKDIEDSQIKDGVATTIKRMRRMYEGKQRSSRDIHKKTHSCVEANLEIFDFDEENIKTSVAKLANLSEEQIKNMNIKQGIFAKPEKYRALIRFSNSNPQAFPDRMPDPRGMAVKLYDVEGEHFGESYSPTEQDIVMADIPQFFNRDIEDYYDLLEGFLGALGWIIRNPIRGYVLLKALFTTRPMSLLTERYWSVSAFSIGEQIAVSDAPNAKNITYPVAVKFGFIPTSTQAPFERMPRQKRPFRVSDNYYQDDIISRLSEENATYYWDFAIQVQTKVSHSIEDVTVEWPEEEAPFFTVGRLAIKNQKIDLGDQFEAGERVRFSPWNGLKAHKPLGTLNRLRNEVYSTVADIRQASSPTTSGDTNNNSEEN